MNNEMFERLLYEEESTTLDFKKEQYRFAKSSDEEKSELLKDILGFANAWRRSEAYILIGVQDVRGGRGDVVGIPPTDHLDDHSLQQFVTSLTNRPVRFHYEAFGFEGKQVGVICIEEQSRPLYLKKDYGKLKKGQVYVRRGSSTDPTKPAEPDEVASMRTGPATDIATALLAIEFADSSNEQTLGTQIKWSAEFCEMPDTKDIPTYDDRAKYARLPGGQVMYIPDYSFLSQRDRANSNYYRQLANYTVFQRLVRKVRLVISNTGEVPATDVRLEITVPNGQGVGILDLSDVPKAPKRREDLYSFDALKKINLRPILHQPGSVDIRKNDDRTKVEIECGSLQPGRKVWTDSFCIAIFRSGEVAITGYAFAANLPQPLEFNLCIDAEITQTSMTMDQLLMLDEPDDERE